MKSDVQTHQIPAASTSERWMVTMAASFGWFFDAYVIMIYSLTIPLIAVEFGTTTAILSGTIGSIFLVGYTLGTIGFGFIADMFGRKLSLGISILGYAVTTAATAFASGVYSLAALRTLTGFGGGGELSVGSPYVVEVWPRERRAWGIGVMYAFYPLGVLFAVAAVYLLVPHFGWKSVYIFALVPAALILLQRLKLEESPRFEAIMARLKETQTERVGLFKALRNSRYKQYRRHLLSGFLIFSALTYGFYTMAFFIPAYVIKTYGVTATGGATGVVAIMVIGTLVSSYVAGYVSDRIGRRMPAIIVAILGMILMALWWGPQWSSFYTFCLFSFLGGFFMGYEWVVGIAYVNELFPTEIRASGFGVSAGLGRVVSIAGPIVTEILALSLGVGHAIEVSAAIWILLIVGYLISHETRGVELKDHIEAAY